jgi:hypothetical protein
MMLWTDAPLANHNALDSALASNGSSLMPNSNPYHNVLSPQAFVGSHSSAPKTVAFIDSTVSDATTVIAGLRSDIVVLLDPTRDGITQITEALGHYKDLTGISIISHGSVGGIQLGTGFLSATSMHQYAPQLQSWASSFVTGADILLYSCDVAFGEVGQSFVSNLGILIGADIAASTDLTGSSSQGGDWTLEYTTGSIETANPFTSSFMTSYEGVLPTLFTTQTPVVTNATDGPNGDYELGMEFRSAAAGQIQAIRYYKAPSETGSHVGRIWSSTGQLLASVSFANETASGWQEQVLTTPLTIQPNTTYVVSVNVNSHYVATTNGLSTTLTNGNLSAVADGSNGVFNETPGAFPTQSWNNSNYFRDIVFTPTSSNPNNNPGTIALTGTATQNQVLTATVSDTDGLSGVTINYQWQQSTNGTTWTNITGATTPTLTLGQAQVGNQVRITATYTDALGSSENLNSTATTTVVNVNDPGAVAVMGITSQGNALTATVTDPDGLPGAIAYQWQQSSNGTTWNNISGATTQTLSLDSSFVGQQVRVNAIYTDVLGGSENLLSDPSSTISAVSQTQSLFTTQTPSVTNATDGSGSDGDYELGMEFRTANTGQISAIRYYKASSETGTHVGKIWSSTGQPLASVTFTNETASGWQQQTLATPLTIQANTTYMVSVNANSHYVATTNGLGTTLTNGDISAIADGSNGVFNINPGNFPTQSWNNSNYFRDIVFTPTTSNPNNNPGSVNVTGITTQNQVLTANVSDTDGLTGATISYQWQQSTNGTTWNNVAGATNQTLTLGQAQVGNQVRVTTNYVDALGTSETITSAATTAIANVNDPGTVAIGGITSQGNTLTATVTDADGLPGAIAYQWQQSSNGTTWNNISGATTQTLSLNSGLVGQQVRVNAIYTDVLGGSENILSNPTNVITVTAPTQTFFASTATPTNLNNIDNGGDDYELGMRFTTIAVGQIRAIRYYKSPSETGSHVGRIWSSTGQLLASVTFTNETASGWQEQVLATPLAVTPGTTYVVSVNTNTAYVSTNSGFVSPISNGVINTPVGAGVYNFNPGAFPTQTFQNENYYRDIVFFNSNNPGTIALNGTPTEDQTLTASVSDTDGLTGINISYQWQKLENGTWTDISGATQRTLKLGDALVNQQLRVRASYTDALGSSETLVSSVTSLVSNINDAGAAILKGSPTTGSSLTATVLDDDGLAGVTVNYQWQELVNNIWTNIAGATGRTLALGSSLLNKQVRMTTTYTDLNGTLENIFSLGTNVTAQNAIVLENQKPGSTAWQITNLATNNEILGYASATSVNQGEVLPIKVSLAQPGQYRIDVYRLGYYGGAGGRFITSSGSLNGGIQTGSTFDPNTRLVESNWNTSYNLAIGSDWTSGLYIAKLTDITTGKESQINFAVRDDDRPADLGFQASFTTYEAYNNYGGYSTYTSNSLNGQRAFKVSFDRPIAPTHQGTVNSDGYTINNMMAWEYNMVRWLESQGYDVSYYTNLDVHTNPLQLYSQDTFLSVGHDEYWSMEMFDSVTKARDNGINLAFFSANTAYWRVRFEDSSTGEPNRVMVSYKSNWALDPVAQNDISQATTLFRSPELNRPENSLLGVAYIGDNSNGDNATRGFGFVVSNSSDPYYAHTGLQNGDVLSGLVGYEWDAVLNNGFTPSGLVVLSASPVVPGSTAPGSLPPLPPGTDIFTSNAVRYTDPSGAKVFSTGSIQWAWGLDSYGVANRVDRRVQQITTNVLADMGAKPQTPSSDIVVV